MPCRFGSYPSLHSRSSDTNPRTTKSIISAVTAQRIGCINLDSELHFWGKTNPHTWIVNTHGYLDPHRYSSAKKRNYEVLQRNYLYIRIYLLTTHHLTYTYCILPECTIDTCCSTAVRTNTTLPCQRFLSHAQFMGMTGNEWVILRYRYVNRFRFFLYLLFYPSLI